MTREEMTIFLLAQFPAGSEGLVFETFANVDRIGTVENDDGVYLILGGRNGIEIYECIKQIRFDPCIIDPLPVLSDDSGGYPGFG